jgi:hypothetical protein
MSFWEHQPNLNEYSCHLRKKEPVVKEQCLWSPPFPRASEAHEVWAPSIFKVAWKWIWPGGAPSPVYIFMQWHTCLPIVHLTTKTAEQLGRRL